MQSINKEKLIQKPLIGLILLSFILIVALACSLTGDIAGDASLEETNMAIDIQSTFNAASAATLEAQRATIEAKETSLAGEPTPDQGATVQAQQATLDAQSTEFAQSQTQAAVESESPQEQNPPTPASTMTNLTIVNNISVPITIKLRGSTPKTITISASSEVTFDIESGDYEYSFSAMGFNPNNGTHYFPPGEYTWTWGKAKQ